MARKATRYIVLHCSATRPAQFVDASIIRQWHKAKGWSDIGYHYVIRRDGTVEPGRAETAIGAHVAGHNASTLGICLVGGLNNTTAKPEDNFTPRQRAALKRLCEALLGRYPGATILGHRDLSPDRNRDGAITPNEWLKACPCFDARDWAKSAGLPPAPKKLA